MIPYSIWLMITGVIIMIVTRVMPTVLVLQSSNMNRDLKIWAVTDQMQINQT